mmetsp:Transcript_139223/g.444981  ORF Transcript_139223/g.444981 Transcript_139223/m.444981 type:complete len:228 (+) Transcript_139223:1167-1850(+)
MRRGPLPRCPGRVACPPSRPRRCEASGASSTIPAVLPRTPPTRTVLPQHRGEAATVPLCQLLAPPGKCLRVHSGQARPPRSRCSAGPEGGPQVPGRHWPGPNGPSSGAGAATPPLRPWTSRLHRPAAPPRAPPRPGCRRGRHCRCRRARGSSCRHRGPGHRPRRKRRRRGGRRATKRSRRAPHGGPRTRRARALTRGASAPSVAASANLCLSAMRLQSRPAAQTWPP